MKISVLGVGTELTTGQILDRNSAWISKRMKQWGVATSLHLVVPDEREAILRALNYCADESDILFVTGGLGPTSDDFTRDVIAQWTGRKMLWDEASWNHIQERLRPRGLAVKDIQKQQCYFPEGSRILVNPAGTAHGFYLQHQGRDVYVLPGPPREIEAIWQDSMEAPLREKCQGLDPLITRSWDTMGRGESEIADRVEAALPEGAFEKAYRVHLPFVEFKLTYARSQAAAAVNWVRAIEEAIGAWTLLRDGEDAAEKLSQVLSNCEEVWICDEIPGSFLLHRLFPFCKKLLQKKILNFTTHLDAISPSSKALILHLEEEEPGRAQVRWSYRGQSRRQIFESPFSSALLRDRQQQYAAEMALIFWLRAGPFSAAPS